MRRWLGRPWIVDSIFAAGVLATELPFYFDGPAMVVTELVIAGSIAVRRVRSFIAAAAFGAAFTVQAVISTDPPEGQLALLAIMMLAYAFGSRYAWPKALIGFVLTAAGGCLHEYFNEHDYAYATVLTAVGWVPGVVVGRRRVEMAALEDHTRVLERTQLDREHAAATAERARLARELHDVVSHTVSAMVIQAAAARQVLSTSPREADSALEQVEQTGQEAITELHRMLGLMREPDVGTDIPGTAEVTPPPDLTGLEGLVRHANQAGQSIDLQVRGHRRTLPSILELSAYRIVQESLTNARKYAPRARVEVLIEYADALELTILDFGDRQRPATLTSGGLGLIGLRERAALLGGTLQAGPFQGGFAVRAVLPIPEPVPPLAHHIDLRSAERARN
jgi:signal transduction histidine kinase